MLFTKMNNKSSNFHARGLLIDVNGVLFDSNRELGVAIPGSVAAIEKLNAVGFPYRLCSNETQNGRDLLYNKLKLLGFSIKKDHILTPAPMVACALKARNLRPYLLVHQRLLPEFQGFHNLDNPNCVVIGDAAEFFTYENLNRAFNVLLSDKNACLISMGLGKYYKETTGVMLDLGAYTKALEYATGKVAEVFGKPSKAFFNAALDDLKLKAEEVVMIGDDIESDIDGAQKCGIRGVQVKTGKWRNEWLNCEHIQPFHIVEDLAAFLNEVLSL